MGLSKKETKILRRAICDKFFSPMEITPDLLEKISNYSDEELRSQMKVYLATKKGLLQESLEEKQEELDIIKKEIKTIEEL